MNAKMKTTLRAWPVIAGATIGLCYLTQTVAKLFGIELPDQQNVEVVRQCMLGAFKSARNFGICAFLLAQVLVLLPAVEEAIFRMLLFKLPSRLTGAMCAGIGRTVTLGAIAAASSALFSAAHYIVQPFPDAAFIALFFFGLAQCWLYVRTGSIWCAMLNHFLFNFTNLVLMFALPQ